MILRGLGILKPKVDLIPEVKEKIELLPVVLETVDVIPEIAERIAMLPAIKTETDKISLLIETIAMCLTAIESIEARLKIIKKDTDSLPDIEKNVDDILAILKGKK